MDGPTEQERRRELEDRPPILGSWRTIYTVVLVSQAIVIALFFLLTRIYGG